MSLLNNGEQIINTENSEKQAFKVIRNRACTDFLHGTCYNNPCRFSHIVSPEAIIFCHDYQNGACLRMKCRFLHYSVLEEEFFRKFGHFPDTPQSNSPPPPVPQPPQVRMNYQSHTHNRNTINERPVPYPQSPPQNVYLDREERLEREHRDCKIQSITNDRYETSIRRIRDDLDIISIIRRFEEEQIMLRRRVESNEMKIAELRASNEYLMAQNAQYRITTANVQCSRVVNPVTVTNSASQQPPNGQGVLSAVSLASVQVQATPIVSIAAPQTQIIASNGTPLAIAANTTQGQQLALAAQQSLSSSQSLGPPPQILSTASLTISPAMASAAPSMGLTINPTSQAITISNATQPIISYPIMTHSILPH